MPRFAGRCHCGNIALQLDWPAAAAEIPARECDCSFCRKHGGLWTTHPLAALRVQLTDPAQVLTYEFGTRTAQFRICARCGVVPLATSRIAGRLYAVVSVNALEGLDPARVRRVPVSFEGESEATRLARRVRYWIPDVAWPK
ncbi:MAG: hypothetical protein JO341_06880 [Gammaproteobacteria bacterium]|nr:hypothetical protein [Gammaproteobacteria bacterium]